MITKYVKSMNRDVTAVVPAYNEGERIGEVLEVLITYPLFKEIIVIDDGSSDETRTVVARYPVRYLRNDINRGKGYSMNRGVQAAKTDSIFFSDADVVGLTHEMIDAIVTPVTRGEVEMVIGMRDRPAYNIPFLLDIVLHLGGERALTKALWQKVPSDYKQHFQTEVALNFYAAHHGRGFIYRAFPGLTQVAKERKYGFWYGTYARWKMVGQVAIAEMRLRREYLKQQLVLKRQELESSRKL